MTKSNNLASQLVEGGSTTPIRAGFYVWRELGAKRPNREIAIVTKRDGYLFVSLEADLKEPVKIEELAEREWFRIVE